jgi:metallophosphoesterase superfamily enzyme
MACGYDAEQQQLPLVFAVVAGEESVANWGWFMQWLRKEVVGLGKITVISDQHLGIRQYLRGQILDGRDQQTKLFTVIVLNTLRKMCIRIVI